jgi:hypothetical protein
MLPGMHMSRLTALVIAVLAVTAAVAPNALAGFSTQSTPVAKAALLGTSEDPIAINGFGAATVAWDQGGDNAVVKARRFSPTGTPRPVLTLSVPGEQSFQSAVASTFSGRSFVAWRTGSNPSGVKGRWVEANGTLRPVLTLLVPDATNDAVGLNVLVSNAGVATVSWLNQKDNSKLAVRRVALDGTLGTPIPDISGGGATDPELAALADGTTVAVWRDTQIEGNTVSPSGVVGTAATISETCGLCAGPGLAVDANGDGIVAWRWTDGNENYAVMARRLTQTGAPTGSELTIDPAAKSFVGVSVPVAADTQDDFIVAWSRHVATNRNVARARRLDETGTFAGTAQTVSGPESANSPVSALTERGNAAVAWEASKTTGSTIGTRARVLGGDASPLAPAVDLVAKGYAPAVASAPAAGIAAFLSEGSDSTSARLDLNRFMVRPLCADSDVAIATPGKRTAVVLPCSGPAIERVVITSPPKHGTLGVFDPSKLTLRYKPAAGYVGKDRFSYRVANDGGRSDIATVRISVGIK